MKSMKTVLGCLIALAVITMCGSVTSPLSAKSVNALPQQKKPPASKVVPHPENWITLTDKKKGYSFDVPQGTVSGTQKSSELDLFMAVVPEPYGVGVLVMAFKDPKLSKDDLINFAMIADRRKSPQMHFIDCPSAQRMFGKGHDEMSDKNTIKSSHSRRTAWSF